jgi:hypothetical protein
MELVPSIVRQERANEKYFVAIFMAFTTLVLAIQVMASSPISISLNEEQLPYPPPEATPNSLLVTPNPSGNLSIPYPEPSGGLSDLVYPPPVTTP